MSNTINESTLEARIDGILKQIFPTFKEVNVQHQKSFSIHFGHHNVSVDYTDPSKYSSRAIFDILLTIDNKNVILLELKKEGLALTTNDQEQGISYARLVHPMPPLALISNGNEIQFFNTYTKEHLDCKEIDVSLIEKITENSFKLAVNDYKEAVNTLLNNDNSIFSKIINQITESKFETLIGQIDDFNKPICPEFQIERELLRDVEKLFVDSDSLVGIVGHSFSGKTSLLYQFFKKIKSENNFLLYLDCYDHNYSILQQLANHFSRNTKVLITKDKIREWLINSLSNNSEAKFYLLLDNFNNEVPEEIKNEIIELIDVFSGINQYTLYTIDEFNFKKIAFVDNRRYKTIIGNQSKILRIEEFTDTEYYASANHMYENFKIAIEHGGYYTQEYRQPRILRHLVSIFYKDIPEEQYAKILAVPDFNYLKSFASNNHYTTKVHTLYKKIVACFIAESKFRKDDSDLNIIASGTGAIKIDTFKKFFPDDLDALIKSSSIVIRELRNGLVVILPKISELIAFHSISEITNIISKETADYKEICDKLIDLTSPVPYCDIVATGVLLNFGNVKHIALFSELIQELLKIPPHYEEIGKGTKTLMYMEGVGHIQMNFEDDMDEGGFITDFMPFAILSQVAGYPLGLVDNEEYPTYAFHLYLLETVASNENFIRRADVSSIQNMKSHESYDWERVGHIVSGHEGIIEPIVQSIQKCFFSIPKEIERLYEKGFRENNFPLIWRIYLALRPLTDYSDKDITNQANSFISKFDAYFNTFMSDFFTRNIEDEEEKKRIKDILKKFKK